MLTADLCPRGRPEEFFKGAAAGSISLVKNSAYGVFNFMSLLMGSVSKGLAVLSLDDDFVQRFSERPANTQEAFIQGAQVRAAAAGTSALSAQQFSGSVSVSDFEREPHDCSFLYPSAFNG